MASAALIGSCVSTTPPTASPSDFPTPATTAAPSVATPAAAAPVAAPSPTGPPPPAVSFRGATFAMEIDDEMRSLFADRGSLVAASSKDGPAPFASKILLAAPARGPWRSVYSSDARYTVVTVADGFVAVLEYREQGGGAYSQKLVVVDLPSGRSEVVDSYALSAATYRGGGGGPPRPTGSMVLGGGLIAWVRLIEGSGGAITGELRVGLPHLPGEAKLVATSDSVIRPVAIMDATTLVYVLARDRRVELRAREIHSGAERTLAAAQLIETSGIVPFQWTARSDAWIGWVEEAPPSATMGSGSSTLRAVNVKTGATHDVPLGQSDCPGLSGNARYFAANCSGPGTAPPRMVLLETASWIEVPVAKTTANGPFFLTAGGISDLLWQDRVDGRRRVIHFTPTTPVASPADGPSRDLVARENAALGYRLSLPSRYRLALSVVEADNVGQDFYSPRSEEADRELCQRETGIGSLERAADLKVVVSRNPTGMSPVDFAGAPNRHILFTAIERTTVGGYDAARIVQQPGGETLYYVIGANDRLYEIAPLVFAQPSPETTPAGWLDQIAATFTAIPFKPAPPPPARRSLCAR